jgi:hypothetical protein
MHDNVFSKSLYVSTAKWETFRFSKRTDCWCELAGASVTKMATIFGVPRAAVSRVMTPYTNYGKTLSAVRNSG